MSTYQRLPRRAAPSPPPRGARQPQPHARSSGHSSRNLPPDLVQQEVPLQRIDHGAVALQEGGCAEPAQGACGETRGWPGSSPERRACSGSRPWWLCRPSAPVPLGHLGMKAPPTPREGSHRKQSGRGRTGLNQTGAKQGLGTTVASVKVGVRRHRRPLEKVRICHLQP